MYITKRVIDIKVLDIVKYIFISTIIDLILYTFILGNTNFIVTIVTFNGFNLILLYLTLQDFDIKNLQLKFNNWIKSKKSVTPVKHFSNNSDNLNDEKMDQKVEIYDSEIQ